MESRVRLTKTEGRRLALRHQLLDGRVSPPAGREGALRCIERLGYVQIDTINVIERAHHHTLWTRLPDYRPEYLNELLAQDRKVFEYWGHAICYLPMADYRFYVEKMHTFPEQGWQREYVERFGDLMDEVYERIRAEGPLAAKDFGGTAKGKTWWDWKPAKIALDLLFTQGRIMVDRRERFQRRYDLTERVLPDWVDTTQPDGGERERFFTRRALAAHGVATLSDIRLHLRRAKKNRKYVDRLVESGEVVRVEIEGIGGDEWFALSESLEELGECSIAGSLYLLSPFDNFVIQRERIRKLFGFDYALECYKPKAQRIMGYFSLPILWGANFVGRIDLKADRKRGRLLVQGLWWEDGKRVGDALREALKQKLDELAAFNGCGEVVGLLF